MIEYTRHARIQMGKRGVPEDDVGDTLANGYDVDVHYPRRSRRKIFTSGYIMEGRRYPHMELTVIYAEENDMLL